MSVLIVTSLGDIVVDLHADLCPLTCKNFLKLCKIKYYNGCLFHTVQKDFTAQTGDPTGTGSGGDSIYKFLYGHQARFFGDEIRLDLKHSKTGTVSMASAGENLNASQFYITLRDDLDYLDGKHTVFGEVAEGLETLQRINDAYVDEKGRPFKNIRIKHTYILEDPFEDPPQLTELIPDASPEGKPKDEVDDDVRLEDDWVPMDEQLDPSELEEVIRAKEAHSRAVVLETIGDIPDAEIKPPDNVLFVCKLNPVTEDEDLHTIFSRFGTVTSADIIRDFKTGDSLCYAFIEFEDKEACEQAYFKMDNALIDDRRIHVDFSQSVAKLWSQYRRKGNQMGKEKGCFKCGAPDHIAKDCTGDSGIKQPSKYILKDDNTQHGGNGNWRYEMVFDGDAARSPEKNKRQRDYELENRLEKKQVYRRSPENFKQRDSERYSSDRSRLRDSDRDYRDLESNQESRSRSSGRKRDHDNRDEKEYGEIDKRNGNRDYEKGSGDGGRRDDRRIERDYRERGGRDDSWRDKKDDKGRSVGSRNDDRRDETDDLSSRKTRRDKDAHRSKEEEQGYGERSRENDKDGHKSKEEERSYRERGRGNNEDSHRSKEEERSCGERSRGSNKGAHRSKEEERGYGERSRRNDHGHHDDRDSRQRHDRRR